MAGCGCACRTRGYVLCFLAAGGEIKLEAACQHDANMQRVCCYCAPILATSTQQPCAPRWCTAKGVRVLSRARRAPALPCPRARRVPRSQRARQRRRRRAMVRRLTGLGCSSLVCLSLCLTERHRVMRAPIRLQPRTGLVGRTVERGGRLAARGRVDRERAAARARVPRRQVWRAILREEARLEDQVQRVVLQGQRACVGKGKAKRSAPFFLIWWHGPRSRSRRRGHGAHMRAGRRTLRHQSVLPRAVQLQGASRGPKETRLLCPPTQHVRESRW